MTEYGIRVTSPPSRHRMVEGPATTACCTMECPSPRENRRRAVHGTVAAAEYLFGGFVPRERILLPHLRLGDWCELSALLLTDIQMYSDSDVRNVDEDF